MSVRKLTPSDLKRATGISGKQNKTIPWHTTQLTVRQFLPLNEYLTVVASIVRDCINPNGKCMAAELLDFSLRVNIISAYAYIDLPENADELYEVIYCSDLYDTVCRHINAAQLDSIKSAVKHIVDQDWGRNDGLA